MILDAKVNDPGPVAAFDEARHGAINQSARFAVGLFHELTDVAADDLLKAHADEIGEAAIDGADFAIEREGQEHIVERVDEVAITLLRAFDDGEKLVEFTIVSGFRIALLESLHQPAQL